MAEVKCANYPYDEDEEEDANTVMEIASTSIDPPSLSAFSLSSAQGLSVLSCEPSLRCCYKTGHTTY